MEILKALYKMDPDGFIGMLTNLGSKINSPINEQGETLLHHAVQMEDDMLIQILIKAGADLRVVDDKCRTPLYWAVMFKNYKAIEKLVQAKAVIDATDIDGNTPLQYIHSYYPMESYMTGILINAGANIGCISHIISNYPKELVAQLDNVSLFYIAHRFDKLNDINDINDNGCTILSYASVDGYTALIKILLKLGADVDILVSDGETAIFGTAANGNSEDNELLVNAGANLNITDIYGQTPLHHAVCAINIEAIKVFFKAGMNIDTVDIDGNTALDYAIKTNNHKIIKLFKSNSDNDSEETSNS